MTRKLAYNRLRFPDGTESFGPFVVCIDDHGNHISHHRLVCEEESTEWVGGTFEIMD